MDLLGDILQGYESKISGGDKKDKCERGFFLRQFKEKLNKERKAAGFPPLSYGRLVKIFEGVKTEDMSYLEHYCSKAKSYTGAFWGKMKGK